MKIVLANNYYYLRGGSERVLFNDMDVLTGCGVTAIPFSAKHPENLSTQFSAYFPSRDDYERAAGARERIHAAIGLIYSRASARAFERLVDDTNPDLVHCHNIYGRLTTSILSVARRRKIPVIMSVHDYKLACPAYVMLRQGTPCSRCCDGNYARAIVHRCHKNSVTASAVYATEAYFTRWTRIYANVMTFLCPSRFAQSVIQSAGIPPDRTVYLPNALDPDRYPPHYESGEYALYVGRLSTEKSVRTLLEALPMGARLKIAGTGPIEPELREIVRLRGLSTVEFEGHCNDQQLQRLYQGAAIIILPSESYENAPMSILEAFAYGKPVVAARIGGIPELVRDGQTGWLFTPGDVAELRNIISEILSQPEAIERTGRNARAALESEFSQVRRTESLLRVYERARAMKATPYATFAETTA
jgi:glycosyltransferase involved in cell wall biosynthesis